MAEAKLSGDESAVGALTAEQEKEQITRALENEENADEVCLIAQKWWRSWCNYSKYPHSQIDTPDPDATKPGTIDNSELCSEDFALALDSSCQEDYDYVYITVPAMTLLKKWYGGGEHEFRRRRIVDPTRKRKIVDLNPLFVKVAFIDKEKGTVDKEAAKYEQFSRQKTLDEIFMDFREKKGNNVDTRLSVPFRIANAAGDYDAQYIPDGFDKEKHVELTRESKCWSLKLEAVDCQNGDIFIFEFRNGQDWPSSKVWKHDDIGVGTIGIGYDKYGKWYHMQVIGERIANGEKEFFCHWLGFKKTWNEWIKEKDKQEKMAPVSAKKIEQKWHPKMGAKTKRATTSSTSASFRSHTGNNTSTVKKSSSTTSRFNTYGRSSYYKHEEGSSAAKGIVGLRNLGNTCFMNSVLQCFNQTPFFHDYFLEDKYVAEINKDNPLGNGGEVARNWAELMKAMWSGKYRVVVPIDFKKTIGQFAPRFMGFQQQDSQELLSFLLDGIHEDLNRIHDKPYIGSIEAGDRPLSEVAQEAWTNHKKRNDSIIVDNMHGQLKSRVECPECSRVSITFDPYSTLSVPIPTDNQKVQIITWIPHDAPSDFVPMSYGVKVPKTATIRDFKKLIIQSLDLKGVVPDTLQICDVYKGKLNTLKKDNDTVTRMANPVTDDFFVYECKPYNTPATVDPDHKPDLVTIPLCHRKPGPYDARFGVPLAVQVDAKLPHSKEDMKNYFCKLVTPYLSEENRSKLKEGDLDVSSLFEVKFLERNLGSRFVSFTPKKWEDMKDVHTIDTILLFWKDLKDYNEDFATWSKRSKHQSCNFSKNKAISLDSCFDCFTQTETLKDDNLWYCSNCKEHRAARKTMTIWTCPNILVVHLKRFSYTRWSRNKITALINFPLEGLNIRDWCKENPDIRPEDCIYDCYGVSNHSGSLGGGHYTAYVKNRENNNWYMCNDSSSYKLDSDRKVVSTESYLLFYRKRSGTMDTDAGRED